MLIDEIPDVEVLLALAPEELAPTLLRLAAGALQNGIFNMDSITGLNARYPGPKSYPRHRNEEIEIALAEAWGWLSVNSAHCPSKRHQWQEWLPCNHPPRYSSFAGWQFSAIPKGG